MKMMGVYGIAQVGLVVERKIGGFRKEQGDERGRTSRM